MTLYVALLRGINVGGHKKIKMLDLKRMFEELGLESVQTYIQSGNVLFRSKDQPTKLRQQLEQRIEEVFGFQVNVVLRTMKEMERVVAECPYDASELKEGENIYVSLLAEIPTVEAREHLLTYRSEADDFHCTNTEIYIFARKSIRESLFSNNFLEAKLGVPATTRNWNTIHKLLALCRAADV